MLNLAIVLTENAQRFPERTAVDLRRPPSSPTANWTRLTNRLAKFARQASGAASRPEDALIMLPNIHEFVIAYLRYLSSRAAWWCRSTCSTRRAKSSSSWKTARQIGAVCLHRISWPKRWKRFATSPTCQAFNSSSTYRAPATPKIDELGRASARRSAPKPDRPMSSKSWFARPRIPPPSVTPAAPPASPKAPNSRTSICFISAACCPS